MRTYELYSIKEPFWTHYGARPEMIAGLLKEYKHKEHVYYKEIEKQVRYITNLVPVLEVREYLRDGFAGLPRFRVFMRGSLLVCQQNGSEAALCMNDHLMILHANGPYKIEHLVLKLLATYDSRYFITNSENGHYNWLKSPVEDQRKFG
ncbi:sporulation inhibitor of replication protein SirA [Priestia endophytica]|uniref:Sporulation inhibitor of replication protein SirA n=1 Tax=Priestia endophytica TaxID=135735 RepID=A0AAX1QG16_9BACI|nr:sporulation inhibitor of replication protein SirA [Priestia endophytica]KAB2494479.1 sporulation inhibitor of replication protein SirA [Priestia endophytica]MBG9814501.1 hypothetical protein [Priestia endophytica]MCM3539052.1 sporulation inhibitor of replication protein SirA [Priestia endophytica]MED4070010.1 sporulation inhibitor of replication protein SirA [Priestia endophytica]RAS79977.1 hypothetical protein A4U60_14970 [Priestia endophytica]